MKRLAFWLSIVFSVAIIIVLVVYFSFRNRVLKEMVEEKTGHFNTTRQASISYEKVCFKGLKTIEIDSFSLSLENGDTLLFIGSLDAGINLFQIINEHIAFRTIKIEHTRLNIEQEKIDEYYRLFSATSKENKSDSSVISIYAKAYGLLNRVFTVIPRKLVLNDVSVLYKNDTSVSCASVGSLILNRGKLNAEVMLGNSAHLQKAIITGEVLSGRRMVDISIHPENQNETLQSTLAAAFGIKAGFKSLNFSFAQRRSRGKQLNLEGICSVNRFEIDHPAVSSKKITFPGGSLSYNLKITPESVELDSISEIAVGELSMHPYFKYSYAPSRTVRVSINIPRITPTSFFASIPADLFSNLKSIQAEGSLSYRVDFFVDLALPDSLRLVSSLNSGNFILKEPDANLTKIKSGFIYTAYSKGIPVRSFVVGPNNPNFRSLSEIPVLLQSTILLAEDDAFFYHKGFLIESIKYALAQDIKQHKLFRGGSTISQQLIKNVYLSHEKSIARKLEEVILVWLIESNRLVSKSRMYEVYLNIIEWGPGVYGANEAAHFYFNKDVANLNPEECIFLASVIPSPRKFYYRFDKDGNLAPFMLAYYNDMSEKLARRGLITVPEDELLALKLKITGPAKSFLQRNIYLSDSINNMDIPSLESEE